MIFRHVSHSLIVSQVKDHSSVTFVKRPSNSQVISKNTSTFTLVLTSLSVRSAIWNSVELMHSANTNWDTEQVTCPVDTVARISCTSVHCDSIEPCIMVSGMQCFSLTLTVKPSDSAMSLTAIPSPLAVFNQSCMQDLLPTKVSGPSLVCCAVMQTQATKQCLYYKDELVREVVTVGIVCQGRKV